MAAHFFLLPRELRDQIYHQYLTGGVGDGYVYNFQSGKLQTSSKKPIDLRLSYTCKLIAEEMRGLALRTHTITFSTVYSNDLRARAGFFGQLLDTSYSYQTDLVMAGAPLMDQGKIQEASGRYPEILPLLYPSEREWNTRYDMGRWVLANLGEARSIGRAAVRHTLQLMAYVPGYAEGISTWQSKHHVDARIILSLPWEPWIIPTKSQVDSMIKGVPKSLMNSFRWTWEFWESNTGKYRFSAAAAAIHFLRSIPNSRCHIRKIILDEDHPAVAYPECHATGLIPFCQENPMLRVERRVSLWRNIFQECFGEDTDWEMRIYHAQHDEAPLSANDITKRVASWMVEASVLGRAGMPQDPSVFTLVLDGSPVPEKTSEIFRRAVQRDAAWQDALNQSYPFDPQDLSTYFRNRGRRCYLFDTFPRLLRELVDNKLSSLIRCTFDPGELCNVDQIVEANKGCDFKEWDKVWYREHEIYDTAPPLPGFSVLLEENIFPRYWEEGE